jgi:hypothetical protein
MQLVKTPCLRQIADGSSRKAVNFSSERTNETLSVVAMCVCNPDRQVLIVGEGENTGPKTCDHLQARWQTIQRRDFCGKKVAIAFCFDSIFEINKQFPLLNAARLLKEDNRAEKVTRLNPSDL